MGISYFCTDSLELYRTCGRLRYALRSYSSAFTLAIT